MMATFAHQPRKAPHTDTSESGEKEAAHPTRKPQAIPRFLQGQVGEPSAQRLSSSQVTNNQSAANQDFSHNFFRIPEPAIGSRAEYLQPASPSIAEDKEEEEEEEEEEMQMEATQAQQPGVTPGGGSGAIPAAVSHQASLALTGDSYTDTSDNSKKNIKFNVTWKGGDANDYVIVNWLKGHIKKPDGTYYTVRMYGKVVDNNFPDWQVDSVDTDPVYWSNATTRWRYNTDSANKFHATDSPGWINPPPSGAQARLDFKTAVYESSDVQRSTSGSISASPITPFSTWKYYVKVLGGGKYDHS